MLLGNEAEKAVAVSVNVSARAFMCIPAHTGHSFSVSECHVIGHLLTPLGASSLI